MGCPQRRLKQIAVVRVKQVLGAPRLHENEVVPVLVAEMDHQPVRKATHYLKRVATSCSRRSWSSAVCVPVRVQRQVAAAEDVRRVALHPDEQLLEPPTAGGPAEREGAGGRAAQEHLFALVPLLG